MKNDKKPMTAYEFAVQVYADIPTARKIERALLSFAAQEAEPLVEALEYYEKFMYFPGDGDIAEKALTTHRAKYPRKP